MQVQRQEASKWAETKITLSSQSSVLGLSDDNSREPNRLSHAYVQAAISQQKKKEHRKLWKVPILF
jgi:hypothetical protein